MAGCIPRDSSAELGSDGAEPVDDKGYLRSQLLLVGWHQSLDGTKFEAK